MAPSNRDATVRMREGSLTLGANTEATKLFDILNVWDKEGRKSAEN